MIEPRRERGRREYRLDVYVRASVSSGGDCSGGHCEARTRARAHTEERNLSLTRILNGCAEARTVGTHYSTTHPPPLSQNSTSSYRSFSFSFSPPSASTSVPRVSLSLFLSPSHPGPPCPHFSRWLVLQTRTTFGPPLGPSLSFSQRTPRATAKLYSYVLHTCLSLLCACHTYTHIRARARTEHTRVASSFHSISRSIPLSFSVSLSVSLLFFFFVVSPRSVTPACNGRPRALYPPHLLACHPLTLPGVHLSSPALSTFKIFPVAAPFPSQAPRLSFLVVRVRGTGEPFPPSTRSREVSPRRRCVVPSSPSLSCLSPVYISRIHSRLSTRFAVDLCPPSSPPLFRIPLSSRESFLRTGIFSRDPLLLSGSLATTFRPSRGLKLAETRLVTDPEERGGRKYEKYEDFAPKFPSKTTSVSRDN